MDEVCWLRGDLVLGVGGYVLSFLELCAGSDECGEVG